MGDIAELKELVAQQSRDAIAAQKRVDDLIAELARARLAAIAAQKRVVDLIAELARARLAAPAPPVHIPVVPNAGAIAVAAAARTDKVSKLGIALRKSYKVKEFKDTHDGSVKEWLTRFD